MATQSIQKPYVVRRLAGEPPTGHWKDAAWSDADELFLRCFHPSSSNHRPLVSARALYDPSHLHVRFRAVDRYVRCVGRGYQAPVSRDSCVEFFVQPVRGGGYFNFEVNCGGALLLYYIEDPRRQGKGFARYTPVPADLGQGVIVRTSMPARIDPELTYGVEWFATLTIPLSLLEHYAGPLGDPSGRQWRGNFYKCADGTSHPHWASWTPLGAKCDFHQPDRFGTLQFADVEGRVPAPPQVAALPTVPGLPPHLLRGSSAD